MRQTFNRQNLKKLFVPNVNSVKGDNGKVIIIGGSSLFHGAPLFALTAASRVVDMVFFGSPEPSIGKVAEKLKTKLFSFIWVPWKDLDEYIEKSDACLIGPGMMRSAETMEITRDTLLKFPHKKWVIDAGSLQLLDISWIPGNAVLTPNHKEFELLFGRTSGDQNEEKIQKAQDVCRKYGCTMVLKSSQTIVVSADEIWDIPGGNPGLTKGGSGDVEAGLTVALLAKNTPLLAASAASFVIKKTADMLYNRKGTFYNSDDLMNEIPVVFKDLLK